MKDGKRWVLKGYQIRVDNGDGTGGAHVGTYQRAEDEGRLMAAAPELLQLLVRACDALDNVSRCSATDAFADEIRARLVSMRLR